MLGVSKPVLTKIFNSNQWENQWQNPTSTIKSSTAQRFMRNLQNIMKKILDRKGKKNNDEERYVQIILSAIVGNDESQNDPKVLSDFFGFCRKTAKDRVIKAREKRFNIFNNKKNAFEFIVQQLRKKRLVMNLPKK